MASSLNGLSLTCHFISVCMIVRGLFKKLCVELMYTVHSELVVITLAPPLKNKKAQKKEEKKGSATFRLNDSLEKS